MAGVLDAELPGQGNDITLGEHRMRNWWDLNANWDYVVSSDKTLTLS